MKKTCLLLTSLLLVSVGACDDPPATTPDKPTPANAAPATPATPASPGAAAKPAAPGAPGAPASAPASGAAPKGSTVVKSAAPGVLAGMIPKSGVSGVVKETMGGGGYTYILLSTKHGDFWVAGPQVPAKKGDKAKVMEGVLMENFSSKTLGKTFENIYFVRGIELGDTPAGGAASAPSSAPGGGPASAPASAAASAPAVPTPKKGEFAVPAGGQTVGQLWAQRVKLGGKSVTFRGRAVKVTGGLVGGLNWVHVQDGTGGPGTNDIIVTTKADVKVGATILSKGTLTLDKEMGPGMKYATIVHNAEVKVE
jgi:hypothetical protein